MARPTRIETRGRRPDVTSASIGGARAGRLTRIAYIAYENAAIRMRANRHARLVRPACARHTPCRVRPVPAGSERAVSTAEGDRDGRRRAIVAMRQRRAGWRRRRMWEAAIVTHEHVSSMCERFRNQCRGARDSLRACRARRPPSFAAHRERRERATSTRPLEGETLREPT
ncbi:hypothetical protein [Burkholderia savannae]|uniref:hypothetical protein n=1 Tax=Burkholderia savannae TaxID=1637837 RepID=UPI0012E3DAD6|nr:hypothetical protein [Burkholderia savannae]